MAASILREATPGEERVVAEFVRDSWQAAYKEMAEPWALADLPVDQWEQDFAEYFVGSMTTVLAEDADSGELIGMCLLATPSRDDDEPDGVAEIAMIHARHDRLRDGIGRALMNEALQRVRVDAWSELTVWAMDGNLRAQAFYKSFGFEPDPRSQKKYDEGFHFPDIRLRLKLR